MIELHSDELIFSFPSLSARFKDRVRVWIDARIAAATSEEKAKLPSAPEKLYSMFEKRIPKVRGTISFQRTLRVPDDGKNYPLPPGLGRFPVRHVDDCPDVSEAWKKRGGVMLPMHKTEAMWLQFSADYPVAFKIAAGGVCAVSGGRWGSALVENPQNYVVLPIQPWLDGFRVTDGAIRQFIGVALDKGLTVEQQLTGSETWGGLQFQAFPMREDIFWETSMRDDLERQWRSLFARVLFSMARSEVRCCMAAEAGLGAGGRIKQEIIGDPYGVGVWDVSLTSRCFAHLCLADDWQNLTGTPPPHRPPTAKDYSRAGLPWFDYDSSAPAMAGETALSGIKSVNALIEEKTGIELPDNSTVAPMHVVRLQNTVARLVREF